MAGRKTKLTPERRRIICAAIRDGASFAAAAAAAGIDQSTLHTWRRLGDEEEAGPYRTLVDELALSEAEGEAIACRQLFASFTEPTVETTVEELPDGSTKTRTVTRPPSADQALKWLERRRASRWNVPTRLALSGDPDAEPITIFRLPDNGRDNPATETAGGASFDAPGRQDPPAS